MIGKILKVFKLLFNFIKLFFVSIKNFVVGIGKFISNFFSFIKGLIDFIYKAFFIVFFCTLAYFGYKIFTGASTMNKKLDELKTSINYIKQISEDLSKATDKISSIADGVNKTKKDLQDKGEKTGKKIRKSFKDVFKK